MRITLILVVVLIITVWNFVRAWTGISWSDALEAYARRPGALYVSLSGGTFALLGSSILWAFLRRLAWAPMALLVGAWTYVLWIWADKLIFQTQERANWPFAAVLTAAFLGWVTAVALDKNNQLYLRKEANERKFQKQSSA